MLIQNYNCLYLIFICGQTIQNHSLLVSLSGFFNKHQSNLSLHLTGICCLEGVHIACEETDSFLTKEDAEKECSLEMLVSAYILEVRPRIPMLSHGEIIGALQRENLKEHQG